MNFLSRALAAFAIYKSGNYILDEAAAAVVDGGADGRIDPCITRRCRIPSGSHNPSTWRRVGATQSLAITSPWVARTIRMCGKNR